MNHALVSKAIVTILRFRGPLSTFQLIDALRGTLSAQLTDDTILRILAQERGVVFDRSESGNWCLLPPKPKLNVAGELDNCQRLYKQGKFSHAAQRAEAILQADPKHASATLLLGKCHFKLGNYRRSTEALRKAVALSPANTSALNALAHALDRLGRPRAACGIVQRLVHLRQHDSSAWMWLFRLLYDTGQYQDVLTAFKAAPSDIKKNPKPILHVAMSLDRLHMTREALALYRYVLKRDPANKVAAVAIGYLTKRETESNSA